jgi:hypothetical protein
MKPQETSPCFSGLLSGFLIFLLCFAVLSAQGQDRQLGFYQVNVPPGWIYDAENSNGSFYTFSYNGAGNVPGYIVQLEK